MASTVLCDNPSLTDSVRNSMAAAKALPEKRKKCEQEKRRFEFQHIVEAWEAKYTFFFGKSEPPDRFSVPETPPPGARNVRRQVRMRRQRT